MTTTPPPALEVRTPRERRRALISSFLGSTWFIGLTILAGIAVYLSKEGTQIPGVRTSTLDAAAAADPMKQEHA